MLPRVACTGSEEGARASLGDSGDSLQGIVLTVSNSDAGVGHDQSHLSYGLAE